MTINSVGNIYVCEQKVNKCEQKKELTGSPLNPGGPGIPGLPGLPSSCEEKATT